MPGYLVMQTNKQTDLHLYLFFESSLHPQASKHYCLQHKRINKKRREKLPHRVGELLQVGGGGLFYGTHGLIVNTKQQQGKGNALNVRAHIFCN
jgi:hypothetical protein